MFDWPDWGDYHWGAENRRHRVYFWAYLPDRVIGVFI
jgi:hypothetical protein